MQWPYHLGTEEKPQKMCDEMSRLTAYHYERCGTYKRYIDGFAFKCNSFKELADVPYVPVRFFKEFQLKSVPDAEVVKTMMSSGTSGQPSKIFLDKATTMGQTRALSSILAGYLGNKRLPMLIIDSPEVISNRYSFSARAAGVTGFSMFSSERCFALDNDLLLNQEAVDRFITEHGGRNFFIFGFTHLIYSQLVAGLRARNASVNLSNGILIHGGGWKKLEAMKIDDGMFKSELRELCGIQRVHNYYGMVEQTGSIFVECEFGHMHASDYSDVLVRDPVTLDLLPNNVPGVLQLLSTLPLSYPGHSLLTEDVGEIVSDQVCRCGRNGKSIRIHGRLERAEVRGCSDSYA